jgi:ABC-type antimicrobial peptide transport system, ATPase component
MSVITVLNASKTYGNEDELKVEALKPVSFSVEKGEFVCIIGTSGSGKSTLLHLLAGVDEATTGQIIINGKDITKLNQESLAVFRRREVGIIYQFFNLVPVLTARENIELPLMLDEKKVNRAYFNEIVELLAIKNRLDFYPSKLSGGEQQRVAIARALIHKPSIILADEPTGNLNSKLAKEIMEFLVLACKKYNQTIVMITHDLNLAGYADRVIEIQDGQIVKDYATVENNRHIQETDLKVVNKQEILKSAQDKINNAVFEPDIDLEIEGLNKESGNYIIDHEQLTQALISIYNIDIRLAQNASKEEIYLSDGLKTYFKWMKESMKVMPEGKALILFNTRRKKAMETFNNPIDLINFVNSLDKKRLMTTKRKNELLKYLQED